jgi:hypothetical protein
MLFVWAIVIMMYWGHYDGKHDVMFLYQGRQLCLFILMTIFKCDKILITFVLFKAKSCLVVIIL